MRALVHYFRVRFAVLPVVEALVLVCAMVLGYQLRVLFGEGRVPDSHGFDSMIPPLHGGLFAGVMLLAMTALGLYSETADSFRVTVQRIFAAYLLTLLALTGVFHLLQDSFVGRGVFAIATVFALGGLLLVRYAAWRLGMIAMPGRRVLVLGDGEEAEHVIETLNAAAGLRVARLAAHVRLQPAAAGAGAEAAPDPATGPATATAADPATDPATRPATGPATDRETAGTAGVMVDGDQASVQQLPQIVDDRRVTDIVVAMRDRRGGQIPLRLLLACKLKGVRVHDLVSFYEQEIGLIRLAYLRSSWLIYGHGFDQGTVRVVAKRTFDIMISSLMLTLMLPVMALAALAVLLESGRPVLFRQERVREHGRTFHMMKFRSMRQDAEKDGKPRWAATDDDRITRVGRFIRSTRIDELPQLLNVLRGDMSFVGPRPERPFFVDQLTEAIPYYGIRHNVKPGITGWAQVRMPYGASVDDAREKLEYDLYYVKNHALFLDLMILFETVQVVLRKKGAR